MRNLRRGDRKVRTSVAHAATACVLLGALATLGCSDATSGSAAPGTLTLDSTRLCAIVPARDPAAAAFPPTPPVKVFGTDLGWTYRLPDGTVPILFGDTWQRIDICPIQPDDDSMGVLELPPDDWPGFTATASIPDAQCLNVDYFVDDAGTAFAPITLTRWDGVKIPMGPLNTPLGGFHDGVREWGVFIVGGGQPCSAEQAATGATCTSAIADDVEHMVCAQVADGPRCVDPSSSRSGSGAQAFYVHFAERVGPTDYVSRAAFLTNKYLNLATRTVKRFDPDDPRNDDYGAGNGALLVWGRPGFEDLAQHGPLVPYFFSLDLPLQVEDGRLVFEPRYLTGFDDGKPVYGDSQADAVPLYDDELEPVNQTTQSWIPSLGRWLMIYSGSTVDFGDPELKGGRGQPVRFAMHARTARTPWGPWSAPQAIFTDAQAAGDQVCGIRKPVGCLPKPEPRIRPQCLEIADPSGGGNLYGANVIEELTRPASGPGGAPAADVFWLYSTWHPYSVVLVRTRVALE
jgi:hypothetical protein